MRQRRRCVGVRPVLVERSESKGEKMKISLRKKRYSGGVRGSGNDVCITRVMNASRNHGVSIRVSSRCMDLLRWRPGDRVLVDIEREGELGTLRLERTNSEQDGLCLSAISKSGSAQVRASLDTDQVAVLFPDGQRGYYGRFVKGDHGAGEFEVDYAASYG